MNKDFKPIIKNCLTLSYEIIKGSTELLKSDFEIVRITAHQKIKFEKDQIKWLTGLLKG